MKISEIRVVAVVVTHNRPQELQQVINALINQTSRPERILVLDNASSIPASQTLAGFPAVDIIRSEINSGGAGGFALGMEHALASSPAWIWLMDDDAIPRPDALEKLLDGLLSVSNDAKPIGALCSAVYEFDKLAPMHRRRFFVPLAWEAPIKPELYSDVPIPIDTGSFVGFLVNANAVSRVGLPKADFFLAYDDTEYSLRLTKEGYRNWLIPNSGIDHLRTAESKLRSSPFSGKHYYNIRNRIVVAVEYAQWKIPAICYAVLVGFAIWTVCGGLKRPESIFLLNRAFSDGLKCRLGKID